MTVGQQIQKRLEALGMSQAELARQVGMSQPGINALIRGSSRSSTHLHKIARVLRTTPAYLTGETDDPDADAPPPAPAPRFDQMMMPVAFPTEAALTEMYEAQLEAFASLSGVALARALAKRLPKALARLQADALYEETDGHRADPEDLEPPATDRSAHRQVRRT